MATLKPNYINLNRMYPASIYAQPSLSPLVLGVNGQVGMAQRQNKAMYDYTIKQMAMSPFSVNSQEYMRRIREEYGITDTGMYDVMGTIGGTVGAGMGAFIGSGLWRGFRKPNTPMTLKFWEGWQGWKTPDVMPSRHQAIIAQSKSNKFTTAHKIEIDNYNKAIDELNKVKRGLDKDQLTYFNNNKEINKLNKEKDALNKMFPNKDNTIKERIKTIDDDIKKLNDANAKIKLPDDDISKAALKNANKMQDAVDTAGDVLKTTAGVTDDVVDAISTGAKIGVHLGKIVPYVGIVGDIISLGMNVAGVYNNIKDWNNMSTLQAVASTVLYGAGALLDLGALVLDVIGILPGADYEIPNAVGVALSTASAVIGAINGVIIGSTIGHSLSPEGSVAQKYFLQNLAQSSMNRPLTSVATALTMVGFPTALQLLSTAPGLIQSKNKFLKGLGYTSIPFAWGADKLVNTAAGNYIRSGVSMYAVQGVQALTTKVEDKTAELLKITPDEAEDVNFVSAFSLWGDINDNLFGATARKATLLGLAKGDPHAQTEALARAWGYSNDDTYYSPMFADVVEAIEERTGKEFAPVVNSILGVIGEVIIDPQNWNEIQASSIKAKTSNELASRASKFIDLIEVLDFTKGGIEKDNLSKFASNFSKLLYMYEVDDKGEHNIVKFMDNGKEVYARTILGRLSKADLRIALRRLADAYLTKGEQGIREVLLELEMHKHSNKVKIVRNDHEPLSKTVFDMFKIITNGGTAMHKDYAIDFKNDLKVDTKKLQPVDLLKLYTYLSASYKNDADTVLSNFLNDFKLNVTDEQMLKLYSIMSDVSLDLSLADTAGDLTAWVATPFQKLLGLGLPHFVRMLSERSRSNNKDQRQRQLVTLKEIEKELSDATKRANNSVKDTKEKLEEHDSRLTTIFAKSEREQDIATQEEVEAKVRAELIDDEELNATKQFIEETLEELSEATKKLKTVHSNTVYENFDYTEYGVTIKVRIQGSSGLEEAETIIKNFEEGLSDAEIKHKVKEYSKGDLDQRNAVATYNAYKVAYENYLYNTKYAETLVNINSAMITALTMYSQASSYIIGTYVKIVSAFRKLQSYVNDQEHVPLTKIYERNIFEKEQSIIRQEQTIDKNISSIIELFGGNINYNKEDINDWIKNLDKTKLDIQSQALLNTYIKNITSAQTNINTNKKDIERYNKNKSNVEDIYNDTIEEIKQLESKRNSANATERKALSKEINELKKLIYAVDKKGNLILRNTYNAERGITVDEDVAEIESLVKALDGIVEGLGVKSTTKVRTIDNNVIKDLQVGIKYTLQDIIHGAFNDILGRYDTSSVYYAPKDTSFGEVYRVLFEKLDIKQWKTLSTSKKYTFIQKFIGAIEEQLVDKDIKEIFNSDSKTINPIFIKRICDLIDTQVGALQDNNIKYVNLKDLSEESLKKYIMQQIYAGHTKYSEAVKQSIKDAMTATDTAWSNVNKAIKTLDGEMDSTLKKIVIQHIRRRLSTFNEKICTGVTGQFLSAYHKPVAHSKNDLQLFITPGSVRKLVPSSTLFKDAKAGDVEGTIDTFVNGKLNQFIVGKAQEEYITEKTHEEIKEKQKHIEDLQNSITPDNAKDILEEIREVEKEILSSVEKDLAERYTDESEDDDTSVDNKVRTELSNYNNKTEERPKEAVISSSHLDVYKHEDIVQVIDAITNGRLAYFHTKDNYTGAHFTLSQTHYTMDDKNTTFNGILKKTSRTTPGHYNKFKQFIYSLLGHDYIKVTIVYKNKSPIEVNYNSDIEYLHKIYLGKVKHARLEVHVDYAIKYNKNTNISAMNYTMNIKFASYFYKAVKNYMVEHNEVDTSDDAVKNYINKAKENKDVITEIYKNAYTEFKNNFRYDHVKGVSYFNRQLLSLQKLEKETIDNIRGTKLEVAVDTPKRKLINDEEIRALLEDLPHLFEKDFTPTSYLGYMLKVVNNYMVEDYTDKQTINYNDFVSIGIDSKDMIVITDKHGKTHTLFDMLLTYRFTKESFNSFVQSLQTSTNIPHIAEIAKTALLQYDELYTIYSTLIAPNTFDIPKEVFMQQEGATEEEYNIMVANTRTLNLLSLLELSHKLPDKNKKFGEDFEKDYNSVRSKLYTESKKLEGYRPEVAYFLTVVRSKELSEKEYTSLLRDVLFYGMQIPVGTNTVENINKKIQNIYDDIKSLKEKSSKEIYTRWELKDKILQAHFQIVEAYKQRLSIYKACGYVDQDDLKDIETQIEKLEKYNNDLLHYKDLVKYDDQFIEKINELYPNLNITQTPKINYVEFGKYLKGLEDSQLKDIFTSDQKYSDGKEYHIARTPEGEYVLVRAEDKEKNITSATQIPNEHRNIITEFFIPYANSCLTNTTIRNITTKKNLTTAINETAKALQEKVDKHETESICYFTNGKPNKDKQYKALVVVEDDELDTYVKQRTEKLAQLNSLKEFETHKLSSITIVSKSQFKQLVHMYKTNNVDTSYKYEVPNADNRINTVINTEAYKAIAPTYINDLQRIDKQIKDNKYDEYYTKLYKCRELANKYSLLTPADISNRIFSQSNTYAMLKKGSANATAYIKFIDKLREKGFDNDANFEFICQHYFNLLNSENDITDLEVPNDNINLINELNQVAPNDKTYKEILIETINEVRKEVTTKVKYTDVLNAEFLNTLVRISDIIGKLISDNTYLAKKATQNISDYDRSPISHAYFTNEDQEVMNVINEHIMDKRTKDKNIGYSREEYGDIVKKVKPKLNFIHNHYSTLKQLANNRESRYKYGTIRAASAKNIITVWNKIKDKDEITYDDLISFIPADIEIDKKYFTDKLNDIFKKIPDAKERTEFLKNILNDYVQNISNAYNNTYAQYGYDIDVEHVIYVNENKEIEYKLETTVMRIKNANRKKYFYLNSTFRNKLMGEIPIKNNTNKYTDTADILLDTVEQMLIYPKKNAFTKEQQQELDLLSLDDFYNYFLNQDIKVPKDVDKKTLIDLHFKWIKSGTKRNYGDWIKNQNVPEQYKELIVINIANTASILRKKAYEESNNKKIKRYNDANEVYNQFNISLFDRDKQAYSEFKTYFSKYVKYFKQYLGFTDNDIEHINHVNTFEKMLKYCRFNIVLDDYQMFNLMMYINRFKISRRYSKSYKDKKLSAIWWDSHKEYLKQAEELLMYQRTGVYKESPKRAYTISNTIKRTLRFQEAMNDELDRIVILEGPKDAERSYIKNKYVIEKRNEVDLIQKHAMQYVTSPLFKKDNLHTYTTQQIQDIRNIENIFIYDTFLEAQAEDIDSIGSKSELYNTTRKLFENVMHAYLTAIGGDTRLKSQFIHIYQITTALRELENTPEMGSYYAHVFDDGLGNNPEVTQAIKECINYFTTKTYLIDLNESKVKAIIGYIWYNSIQGKQLSVEELSKFFTDQLKKIDEVRALKNSSVMQHIYTILDNINITNKHEQIAKIIYNKDYNSLDKNIQEDIITMIDMQKSWEGMDAHEKHDTLEVAFFDQLQKTELATSLLKDIINKDKELEDLKSKRTKLESYRENPNIYLDKLSDDMLTFAMQDTKESDKIKLLEFITSTDYIEKLDSKISKDEQDLREDYFNDKINIIREFIENNSGLLYNYITNVKKYLEKLKEAQTQEIQAHIKSATSDTVKYYESKYEFEVKYAQAEDKKEFLENNLRPERPILKYNKKDRDGNNIEVEYKHPAEQTTKYINLKAREDSLQKTIENFDKFENLFENENLKYIDEFEAEYNEYKGELKDVTISATDQLYLKVFSHFIKDVQKQYKANNKLATKDFINVYLTNINNEVPEEINKKFKATLINKYKRSIKNINSLNKIASHYKLKDGNEDLTFFTTNDKGNRVLVKDETLNKRIDILESTLQQEYENIDAPETKPKEKQWKLTTLQEMYEHFLKEWYKDPTIYAKAKEAYEDATDKAKYINKILKLFLKDNDKYSFTDSNLQLHLDTLRAIYAYNTKKDLAKTLEVIKAIRQSIIIGTKAVEMYTDPKIKETKLNAQALNTAVTNVFASLGITDMKDIISDVNLIMEYGYDNMYNTYVTPSQKTAYENLKHLKKYKAWISSNETSMKEFIHSGKLLEQTDSDIAKITEEVTKEKGEVKGKLKENYNKNKLRNIDLFKAYYEVEGDDKKVIDSVINEIKKHFVDAEDIDKKIEEAGDKELHNPVIDCLITTLNAMHQRPTQTKFTVVDIETITDKGTRTPYQITLIHVDGNKIKIHTSYFNNPAFFQYIKDENNNLVPIDDLEGFRKQQLDVWGMQEGEEFDAKFNALVKRVQAQKNNLTTIKTIMAILNINCPKVAHNGERFDFPIIDGFFKTMGRRLLTNTYYTLLQENNSMSNIKHTVFDESHIKGIEAIVDENYKQEITKLIDELKVYANFRAFSETQSYTIGQVVTYDNNYYKFIEAHTGEWDPKHVVQVDRKTVGTVREAEIISKIITTVGKAAVEQRIAEKLVAALKERGFVADADILYNIKDDPEGPVQTLLNAIDMYINTDNKDEALADIHSVLTLKFNKERPLTEEESKQLKLLIDTLLKNITKKYNAYLNGASITFKQSWKHEILNKLTEEISADFKDQVLNQEDYNLQTLINNTQLRIDELNNNEKMITGTKAEYKRAIKTQKAILKELTDEKNKLEKVIKDLNDSISNYLKEKTKSLQNMLEYTNTIKAQIQGKYNTILKLKNKISKDIDTLIEGDVITSINSMMFEYEKNLRAAVHCVEVLYKTIEYAHAQFNSNKITTTSDKDYDAQFKKFLIDYVCVSDLNFNADLDTLTTQLESRKNTYNAYIKDNKLDTESEVDIKDKKLDTKSEAFTKLINNISKDILDNVRTSIKYYEQRIEDAYNYVINNIENEELKNNIRNWYTSNEIKTKLNIDDLSTLVKDTNNNKVKLEVIRLNKLSKDYQDIIKLDDALNSEDKVADEIKKYTENTDIQSLITSAITKNIERINNTLSIISYLEKHKKTFINMDTVDKVTTIYSSVVQGLRRAEDNKKHVLDTMLVSYITNNNKRSDTKDKDEFRKNAREKKKISTHIPGKYTYEYVDLRKNNNTNIFILRNDRIYVSPDEINNSVTFVAYDEYHMTQQTFRVPLNEEGIMELHKGTFTFTYDYNTVGHQLYKTSSNTAKYNYTSLPEIKDLKSVKSELMRGLDYNKDIYRAHGRDYSMNSIEYLIKFVTSLSATTVDKVKVKDYKTVSSYNVSLKNDLKKLNITEHMYARATEYLSNISYAYNSVPVQSHNTILQSIAKEYERKLVGSLEPGNITPIMPHAFSNPTFTFTYDELEDMGISPYDASEGSMGMVFRLKDNYTIQPLFTNVTNSVRNVIASKIIYQTSTPIEAINDLQTYGINIRTGSIKDITDEQIKNTITKRYKDATEEQLKVLIEEEKARIKYLSDLQEDEPTLFTPIVQSKETQSAFDADTIHGTGMNAKVLFVDIPDCFEDVIIVDEDFARYAGYSEAFKTWLSGQGFKGAIIYKKGIYNKFGAHFLASHSSVKDRGTYGTAQEQALNNLRDYYRAKNSNKSLDNYTDAFKKIADNEKVIKLIKGISRYNKLFLDITTDYMAEIDKIMGKHDAYLDLVNYKIPEGCTTTINMYDTKLHRNVTRTLTIKGTGSIGKMYIIMDAGHTADHMVTRVRVETDGTLTVVKETETGGAYKGPLISNTVVAAMRQSIGDHVDELLDVKGTNEKTLLYIQLQSQGLKQLYKDALKEKDTLTVEYFQDVLSEQLLADMHSYIYYHDELEKEKSGDNRPEYITWYNSMIDEIDRKVRNKAAKHLSGDGGAIYADVFNRHVGVRHQLGANLTITMGEARVPLSSFKYLKNQTIANETIGYNLRSDTDLNTLKNKLISIEESSNKVIERFNIEKRKDLQNKITTLEKAKEDYAYFKNAIANAKTNPERVQIVRELLAKGYLEQGENGHTNYVLNNAIYEQRNGEDVLVYVEDIELKDALQSTYMYMLAVRSPVQDYNATPILKITGFVEHPAMECNPYLYGIIGGDNDGDTAAFTCIKRKHMEYQDGEKLPIGRKLDATREDFYDKGYIEKVNKKGLHFASREEETNLEVESNVTYGGTDSRYAYMGKRTVPEDVRTTHAHYTFEELFSYALTETELKTILKEVKDISEDEIEQHLKNNKTFWINVHIRKLTGGTNYVKENNQEVPYVKQDEKGNWKLYSSTNKPADAKELYKDSDYIDYYINQHKQEIKELIKHQLWFKSLYNKFNLYETVDNILDKTSGYVQTKIGNAALVNTLQRGAYSKSCINYMGSRRKYQIAASIASVFTNMNKDDTGENWTTYYDIKNPANLTVKELALSIFGEVTYNNLLKDSSRLEEYIKQIIELENKLDTSEEQNIDIIKEIDNIFTDISLNTNLKAREDYYTSDYVIALRVALQNVYAYHIAKDELQGLYNLFTNKKATYKDVVTFIETTYRWKSNDPLFHEFHAQWSTKLDTELEDVDKEIIRAAWFGRYTRDSSKFFNDKKDTADNIEKLAQGYLEQTIITRPKSKAINDLAQNPISMSKHGALGLNIPKLKQEYIKEVVKITEDNAKRRINIGMGYDGRIGFAMGMEYDAINNNDIKYVESKEQSEARSKVYEGDLKGKQKLTDPINSKQEAIQLIRSAVRLDFKHEMFNNPFVPSEVVNTLYETYKKFIELCSTYDSIKKAIKESTTLLDYIDTFNKYGIPFYRITKHVVNSLTISNTVVERWNNDNPAESINMKVLPEIKDAMGIFVLSRYLREDSFKKELLQLMNKKDSRIYNFFFNITQRDIKYADEHIEKSLMFSNDLNEDGNIINRLKFIYDREVPYSNPNTYEPFSEKMTEELSNELKFERAQTGSLQGTIDELEQSYLLNITVTKHLKEQIEEIKNNPSNRKLDVLTKRIHTILNPSKEIRAKLQDEEYIIRQLNLEIAEKEKEAKQIEQKLRILGYSINDKQQHIIALRSNATNNLKKRIQNERKELETQLADYKRQALVQAFYDTLNDTYEDEVSHEKFSIGNIYNILVDEEGRTLYDAYDIKNKQLTQKDIDNFKDKRFKSMEALQVPFMVYAQYFKKYKNGIYEYDWNDMWQAYKKVSHKHRLTIVLYPFDDETLVKNISSYVHSTSYDKDTRKELSDIMKKWTKGSTIDVSKLPEFMFDNKTFKGIRDVDPEQFVTPTLKEIAITSAKDLQAVYEFIINPENKNIAIGFTSLNDVMEVMSNTYNIYGYRGKINKLIMSLMNVEKFMMRASAGFIVRNAMDTFTQLMTELYQRKGFVGMLNPKYTLGILLKTEKILDLYKYLSEERTNTMIMFDNMYIDTLNILSKYSIEDTIASKDLKILNGIYDNISEYLTKYIEHAESSDANTRMKNRVDRAKTLKDQLEKTKRSKKYYNKYSATLKNTVQFLTNLTFAEYFILFDDFNLNKDSTKLKNIKQRLGIDEPELKTVLFELSAFMQTNAQVDYLRESSFEVRDKARDSYIEQVKQQEESTHEYTYEEIKNQIRLAKKSHTYEIHKWIKSAATKGLDFFNTRIENVARTATYLYGKAVYDLTFNETVTLSLRQWFNYGQKSPLEQQLSFDIPYFSFPIRSVMNWNERLMNPRFHRLMDDIIDGVYGQYADEDGQYSEWEQFMIQNGWVPIANGLGIRFGTGVFDIQNLLGNTSESIKQRYSPVLRGLSKLIESGKLSEAIGETATYGLIKRNAKAVLPTQAQQNLGISKQQRKTLANSSSMFFEYNENEYTKYTPYKYRNNARWKYYENIYKDWFNKYGRMRKPTVDPVTLVNNIQWKQFLRWKQNQLRRR